MTTEPGAQHLIALTTVTASADDASTLLAAAMPVLCRLAAADAALVLAPAGDEVRTVATCGVELPADLGVLSKEEGFARPPVPAAWAERGVRAVATHQLPGQTGTLTLAWTAAEPPTESSLLDAGAHVLDSALGRLVAEERLADLVHRVDHAQHLAGMGDYDWHIPTDTNRWSDELYRIYGYEPQSFNASYERFLGNIHPDDRERIQQIHQQAYATGEPYQMIERIVRPDGELRYLSSNGEVIMGPDGTPVRMRGTCIDITERVLAEQETELAAQRFRGLVEASPDAILVLDPDGTILHANQKAVDMLGADPAGHDFREIMPAEAWEGGQGIAATTFGGAPLLLDVITADLTDEAMGRRTAVFLQDAHPRVEREAMAARLGQVQQRRRQALEINDNLVQGLTSAVYALDQDNAAQARSFVERTLRAARDMMDDLLEPSGSDLRAGDLVRSAASRLEAPAPETSPRAERDLTVTVRAHRVLIVDDAEDVRMLLRMKLSREPDLEVVGEAVDGVDAVDRARELQPHLVLLDMAMPRMDGLQALPLIREAVPHVRVIVLSGFNQTTLESEALAAGADRYIVKGGSMRELVEVIGKVLHAA